MVITEIFKSIQGESSFAGLPCVFVRLTGCNMRCHWCDTAYAFHGGQNVSPDEVLDRVRQLGGNLVEFTGGEPLLQKEVEPLAGRMVAEGFRILIETSGERFVGNLPREVVKILDVKCPGSGESDKFCMDNLGVIERKDEIKFVVVDEDDYRFALDFIARHRLHDRVDEIILSPVFGRLHPRRLAEWILRDRLEVRMGMQIHKFIWDPEMKGV
ncbi:MAG TPA: radical SAM protein [Terriglobia bacterium]|nr:radical SAM protein [Terriglobia bacterium]